MMGGSLWLVQIRNTQLEKEALELRAENATLQQAVEHSAHAAVSNEKVCCDLHHYFLKETVFFHARSSASG